MLDTNTVSYMIRGRLQNEERLRSISPSDLCISAITEGELLFGIARRPEAHHLAQLVHQFLKGIESLPFDSVTARQFSALRTIMQKTGKSLTQLDMLIAAYALSIDAVLVTSDKAFLHVPGLRTESWA